MDPLNIPPPQHRRWDSTPLQDLNGQDTTMATKKTTKAASKGDDRQKALDAALALIEKDFGKGAVMRLGDENRPPIQVISSGNTALDIALGIGGFPRGRV